MRKKKILYVRKSDVLLNYCLADADVWSRRSPMGQKPQANGRSGSLAAPSQATVLNNATSDHLTINHFEICISDQGCGMLACLVALTCKLLPMCVYANTHCMKCGETFVATM
jgi:hypothetical protein